MAGVTDFLEVRLGTYRWPAFKRRRFGHLHRCGAGARRASLGGRRRSIPLNATAARLALKSTCGGNIVEKSVFSREARFTGERFSVAQAKQAAEKSGKLSF